MCRPREKFKNKKTKENMNWLDVPSQNNVGAAGKMGHGGTSRMHFLLIMLSSDTFTWPVCFFRDYSTLRLPQSWRVNSRGVPDIGKVFIM